MLSDLVKLFIDPLFIFTFLVTIAFVFYLIKNSRMSKGFLAAGFAWFLIISTPWIPNLLITSLEFQYHPIHEEEMEELQGPVDVIVLGGGHSNDPRLPANSRLTQQSLMRLAEGIRLHRMIPESTLVLSGDSSRRMNTQAENFASTAISLGIDERGLSLQNDPDDTWQEVRSYRERAQEMDQNGDSIDTLIVVTSAAHMPRAVRMFEDQLSMNVLASPTDFRHRMDEEEDFGFRSLLPAVENIEKMKDALREYGGLAEFYLFLRGD